MTARCPTCLQLLPETGDLMIDEAGIVVRAGRFATLTKQQAEILNHLAIAAGALVTRERLHANLYPIEADEAAIKIIDVHVCKMRAKLKPLGVDIHTVWGRGYRLVPGKAKGDPK